MMSVMVRIPNVPDYLLDEIRQWVALPTPEEMRARLQGRKPMRLSEPVAEAVRAERDSGADGEVI
jgi:hypothetical protein